MNSRELILANFNHEKPLRAGLNFDGCRYNDMVFASPGHPIGYTPHRWTEGDMEYYDDIWGNIWGRMKDGCKGGEVITPVLEDWSKLRDFKLPQYNLDQVVNCFHIGFSTQPDCFKVAYMPGWIFAQARYIRKLENYLMDMVLYPDELHELHARMSEIYKVIIIAAGKAGANAIFFAEDLGTQNDLLFSPYMWQDYFGILYKELFGLAHEHDMKVMMHSCGQNRKLLEPLLQAGVDCFQFDQPTVYDFADLTTLLCRYNAVLWSPIDIQRILPTGNRELIEQGVTEMIKYFDGGLIFRNYSDLVGIGVKTEWDNWAYEAICNHYGLIPKY